MIIIYSCHWFFLGAIAIVFLRQQQAFAVLIWTGIAGNVFLISLDAYSGTPKLPEYGILCGL